MPESSHRPLRPAALALMARVGDALLFLGLIWSVSVAHAEPGPRRVLILQPYNYTFPATGVALEAIRERLLKGSPQKPEIDVEYLNLIRASDPRDEQMVVGLLRARYAQQRHDVVMVVSGDALPFMVKHRDEFAPRVPAVFIGVSRETYEAFRLPDITGHIVELDVNLSETLALAERLQPDARRLVIVAGGGPADRRWQAAARRVIERRQRKFETTYLFELPHEELVSQVSKLPGNAIVLILSVFRDGTGASFVPREVATTLAKVSPAPVYSPYVGQIGSGVVGGFGETFESMGVTGADMVLEILAGKDPATMPPRPGSDKGYRVDDRAMQRWHLNERNLPPGTDVLYKAPSIWDQHSNLVIAALLVFGLQSAFAGALLVQRRRRRSAELHLRESEERLTLTAAAMNVGLWQFDRKTEEFWATEYCRQLFGLSEGVPLSRENLLNAIHAEDQDTAVAELREALRKGLLAMTDFRIVLPDGQVRWIRARSRSQSADSDESNLSGLFVEVTEQKAAEVEADVHRREVAHLGRVSALGELSGAIAHEVNQPLTAILSNAEAALDLLSRQAPHLTEVREALADIVEEDNRASEVIMRLRRLLKKGAEKFELLNANDFVEATLKLLHGEVVSRRVTVKTMLAEWLPPVSGDAVQLEQVLLNLIVNAMDAMTATPTQQRIVTVTTCAGKGDTVEVTVADQGPGIKPEQQNRVFESFYTTKADGLGLGLTICSTIIRAHGGTLTLANQQTGGAVATLSLRAQAFAVAAQ
jgi:signal transduction histidine kinase